MPKNMHSPRRTWLTLEGAEVIEMKQVVLDRDVPGATDFFHEIEYAADGLRQAM